MANVQTRFANIGFRFGGLGVVSNQVQGFLFPQDIVVHSVSSSLQHTASVLAGWCNEVVISGGFGISPSGPDIPFNGSDAIHSYYFGLNTLPVGSGIIGSVRDSMNTPLNGFIVRSPKQFNVTCSPIGTGPFLGTTVTVGVFTVAYNTLAEWRRGLSDL